MAWPGMVEYSAAVQDRRTSFLAPELKSASIVTNKLGLPKVCSGAFAIVYELKTGRDTWAIRCFTKDVGDLQERYAAIAEHLKSVRLPQFVPFDYLKDGIRVNGKVYPIMKMQWVEGVPLTRYVEENLVDPKRLLALAEQFGELSAHLERQRIGHGDLSADNVLMAGDEVRLIDYDGMFVPRLGGRKARELGNPAFQHPKRHEGIYGPEIDRFATLVIATALAGLAADPSLWLRHGSGNGLLFSPVDLRDPKASPLFRSLFGCSDATVKGLAAELAKWCQADPAKVAKLPALKGLKVKAGAAAPGVAPPGGLTVAIMAAGGNGSGPGSTVPAAGAAPRRPRGPSPLARMKAWWQRRQATTAKRRAARAAARAAKVAATRAAKAAARAAKAARAAPPPARVQAAVVAAQAAHPRAFAAAPVPVAPRPSGPSPSSPAPSRLSPSGQTRASLAATDWTGAVVAALVLGCFAVLFAPETRSFSVVALPAVLAFVAWGDAASQRTLPKGPIGGWLGVGPADRGGLAFTAIGTGVFAVLFAPETRSLSLLALPAVLSLVWAGKRAVARSAAGAANRTP